MAVFRCGRFPTGEAHIRTPLGTIVLFVDGRAEVDDPELAAALREVPPVFEITQEGGGEPPASRPRAKKRTTTAEQDEE